jgi:MFS superfamily sulfate permease-like transporter
MWPRSTKRILGAKVRGTDNPQSLEFIKGCLIIKIPEPLTFANTGDRNNRLRRLQRYGTTAAHPARPRVRDE